MTPIIPRLRAYLTKRLAKPAQASPDALSEFVGKHSLDSFGSVEINQICTREAARIEAERLARIAYEMECE